jgi:phage-related protein
MIALGTYQTSLPSQTMGKKRKLSNFTTDDRSDMLLALQHFQETLDPEDEELPTGIRDTLNQLRQKLERVKVRYDTYIYLDIHHDRH